MPHMASASVRSAVAAAHHPLVAAKPCSLRRCRCAYPPLHALPATAAATTASDQAGVCMNTRGPASHRMLQQRLTQQHRHSTPRMHACARMACCWACMHASGGPHGACDRADERRSLRRLLVRAMRSAYPRPQGLHTACTCMRRMRAHVCCSRSHHMLVSAAAIATAPGHTTRRTVVTAANRRDAPRQPVASTDALVVSTSTCGWRLREAC